MANKVIHTGTPDLYFYYDSISLENAATATSNGFKVSLNGCYLSQPKSASWFDYHYRVILQISYTYRDDKGKDQTVNLGNTAIKRYIRASSYKDSKIYDIDPDDFTKEIQDQVYDITYNDIRYYGAWDAFKGYSKYTILQKPAQTNCWFRTIDGTPTGGQSYGRYPKDNVDFSYTVPDVPATTHSVKVSVIGYSEPKFTWKGTYWQADFRKCTCADCVKAVVLTDDVAEFYTDFSGGTISSIVDNYSTKSNYITINATASGGGINNTKEEEKVHYAFYNGSTFLSSGSYNFSTTNQIHMATNANKVIAWVVTKASKKNKTSSGTEDGTALYKVKDKYTVRGTKKTQTGLKYYLPPNNPTSIWYISDSKEKSTDTKYSTNALKPKVKKELAWNWAGATSGNSNSSITGYRIFIYKNEVESGTDGTSMHISSAKSDADSSVTPVTVEDTGTRGHEIETTQTTNTSDNLNFKFVPKDAGFAANDTCCCRVFSVTTWGDGTEHYSSGGIRLDCVLKNGAVVWVRIHDPAYPDDPTKLKWAEGTVYVHNGSAWKEAEGVYVRKGGQWKEST
jgi:hypothetical protein